jgi:adenylate cyclase
MIDKVMVRGKTQGTRIFYPKKKIGKAEAKGWKIHNMGMNLYYKRDFEKAFKYFIYAREFLENDPILPTYLNRCKKYIKSPPPKNWEGYEIISEA